MLAGAKKKQGNGGEKIGSDRENVSYHVNAY